VVDALTGIGRRLTNALTHRGPTENIVLLVEAETLDAELLQEDEAEAKAAAEKAWPRLMMLTGGSCLGGGATGYVVVWRNSQTWEGIKAHMGHNQASQSSVLSVLRPARD